MLERTELLALKREGEVAKEYAYFILDKLNFVIEKNISKIVAAQCLTRYDSAPKEKLKDK
ncbi:MAG: hypothetical protein M1348_01080 [Candidatus Parvarchaeota archaeon]|nr:hypothetical protein [Candidatus Parvarchaeota archaeon]